MSKLLIFLMCFAYFANGESITFQQETDSTKMSTFEIFATTDANNPALCSLFGYKKKFEGECDCCNAFAYDSVTNACQIGKTTAPSGSYTQGQDEKVFIIESRCETTPPPAGYQKATCNQYFKVVNTTATQADAKAACVADGGTLAIINSQEALDWVKAKNMTTTVWIGLEGPGACINKACNGLLSWADGAMFNFADAVLDIVNGNEGYNCWRYRSGNNRFLDGSCDVMREYICEYKC